MRDRNGPPTQDAFIAIGSNLGDRDAAVAAAFRELAALPDTAIVASSTVRTTAPVGPGPQQDYRNAVARIRTSLDPRRLLELLLEIERRHGRQRTPGEKWGPRTLDLDIVLFGALRIDEPGLTIPHPRLHERRFVLEPLAELAPGIIVPGLERTARALLADLPA